MECQFVFGIFKYKHIPIIWVNNHKSNLKYKYKLIIKKIKKVYFIV